jgi:hypothetical protein
VVSAALEFKHLLNTKKIRKKVQQIGMFGLDQQYEPEFRDLLRQIHELLEEDKTVQGPSDVGDTKVLEYFVEMYRAGMSSDRILDELRQCSEWWERENRACAIPHSRPDWTAPEHMKLIEEIVGLYRVGGHPVAIFPRLEKLDQYWEKHKFPSLEPYGQRDQCIEEQKILSRSRWTELFAKTETEQKENPK